MNRLRYFSPGAIFGILFALTFTVAGAERFGDIIVGAEFLASGETHHGYREYRILLENRSEKTAHTVTLVFPDRPYGFGNHISRMARTVSLAPSARAVVPLWQPPLPAEGNNNLSIVVDDEEAGTIGFTHAGQHMTSVGYGGTAPSAATVLVSRSLNYDEAGRALKAEGSAMAFTAAAAVGPPDSLSPRGAGSPAAWMPEPSSSGPHWLEVDFDPPMQARQVRIHETLGFPPGGEIILKGASGTNLGSVRIPPAFGPRGRRSGGSGVREISFPPTSEPVKTVRMDFGPVYGGSISVDAVELVGMVDNAWATAARASSECSVSSSPGPATTGAESRELSRAEVPVTEWSDYWLSYSPYDAVALSAADLRGAPPSVQSALWRYAECGGILFLIGHGDVPEPWHSLPTATFEGGKRFAVGFGQCFVFETDRLTDLKPSTVKLAMGAINSSARFWQSLPDAAEANRNFPVIENFHVPVRGTVFVMLVFVVLIGPVNLIVLSRTNRRTWLLWTIPAISLFTCLVVLVYSLLREGITPDVRTDGLTLLDQVNRRATSWGTTAFYCPLTPSQGLFFGFDTEATPLVEAWSFRYGGQRGTAREVDWTQSQHLQRGWVTSRVPAHFQLRKSETRRERLQLERSDGQLTVVNGLGASIRSLQLVDASGRLYTAGHIPAGQKAALVAAPGQSTLPSPSAIHSFFPKLGDTQPESLLATNGVTCMLPNTYLAELESNPFLENGLGPKAKSSRNRDRAEVFGILEPSPQP